MGTIKFKMQAAAILVLFLFFHSGCDDSCECTQVDGLTYSITAGGYFGENMKDIPDFFLVFLKDFDKGGIDYSSKCDSIFSASTKILKNEDYFLDPTLFTFPHSDPFVFPDSKPFILHLVSKCVNGYEPPSEFSIGNVFVSMRKVSRIELFKNAKRVYSKDY